MPDMNMAYYTGASQEGGPINPGAMSDGVSISFV